MFICGESSCNDQNLYLKGAALKSVQNLWIMSHHRTRYSSLCWHVTLGIWCRTRQLRITTCNTSFWWICIISGVNGLWLEWLFSFTTFRPACTSQLHHFCCVFVYMTHSEPPSLGSSHRSSSCFLTDCFSLTIWRTLLRTWLGNFEMFLCLLYHFAYGPGSLSK